MARRVAPIAASLGVVLSVGCGAGSSATRTSTTTEGNSTTTVAVTVDPNAPRNPTCEPFCKRLAECWYAVPNVDPMKGKDQVTAECRTEHHDCREETRAIDCCATASDCQAFAHCYSTTKDGPSTCGGATD